MKLHWAILSVIALLSFSVMLTAITFVTRKGVPMSLVLFLLSAFFTLFYFGQTLLHKDFHVSLTIPTLVIFCMIGISGLIGNWAQFTALVEAPNPGLAIAIISAQSGLIAIFSFFLFKNGIAPIQIAGLILSFVSIALISMGTKPQ